MIMMIKLLKMMMFWNMVILTNVRLWSLSDIAEFIMNGSSSHPAAGLSDKTIQTSNLLHKRGLWLIFMRLNLTV